MSAHVALLVTLIVGALNDEDEATALAERGLVPVDVAAARAAEGGCIPYFCANPFLIATLPGRIANRCTTYACVCGATGACAGGLSGLVAAVTLTTR
jgi:hypothetical protein